MFNWARRAADPLSPRERGQGCEELRLILELDGEGHFDPSVQVSDAERTHNLQARGYTLARIENEELPLNPEIVFARITRLVEALKGFPHP